MPIFEKELMQGVIGHMEAKDFVGNGAQLCQLIFDRIAKDSGNEKVMDWYRYVYALCLVHRNDQQRAILMKLPRFSEI